MAHNFLFLTVLSRLVDLTISSPHVSGGPSLNPESRQDTFQSEGGNSQLRQAAMVMSTAGKRPRKPICLQSHESFVPGNAPKNAQSLGHATGA